MRHGSLFSGIGGFDLAAEWMGWENIFHCEWNEFGQKILKHYWPNAKSYGDITKTDFTIHRGSIDIISGGFPCQPYSVAGKRKGDKDDRHLWPEMLRVITEIQPRWVVGENVPGLISWGKGMVFQQLQADLETAGYEVFPPIVLPACSIDAPHRRDRLWIVAHARSEPEHSTVFAEDSKKLAGEKKVRSINRELAEMVPGVFDGFRQWRSMGEPGLVRENDGIPEVLDRLKALGNSIVPQVVYQIFKAIEQFEKLA